MSIASTGQDRLRRLIIFRGIAVFGLVIAVLGIPAVQSAAVSTERRTSRMLPTGETLITVDMTMHSWATPLTEFLMILFIVSIAALIATNVLMRKQRTVLRREEQLP